jgi:hypothetical protein
MVMNANGYVTGALKGVLQLEGLGMLALSVAAYSQTGLGWGWFFGFFLAPDLAALGYIGGQKAGAAAYNAGHSYIGPMLLLAAGFAFHVPPLLGAGLIWMAHIGLDRALGYGLKYADGFGATHLGVKGRSRPVSA